MVERQECRSGRYVPVAASEAELLLALLQCARSCGEQQSHPGERFGEGCRIQRETSGSRIENHKALALEMIEDHEVALIEVKDVSGSHNVRLEPRSK